MFCNCCLQATVLVIRPMHDYWPSPPQLGHVSGRKCRRQPLVALVLHHLLFWGKVCSFTIMATMGTALLRVVDRRGLKITKVCAVVDGLPYSRLLVDTVAFNSKQQQYLLVYHCFQLDRGRDACCVAVCRRPDQPHNSLLSILCLLPTATAARSTAPSELVLSAEQQISQHGSHKGLQPHLGQLPHAETGGEGWPQGHCLCHPMAPVQL